MHLDDNLRRTIVSNPMCVTPASRCALEAAVWADTAFLASLNVMDYSLLVSHPKRLAVPEPLSQGWVTCGC